MNSKLTWLDHLIILVIGGIVSTGAITELVPAHYQTVAWIIVGIIGYVAGVKVIPPKTSGLPTAVTNLFQSKSNTTESTPASVTPITSKKKEDK